MENFIEQYTRAMTEELHKRMEEATTKFLINQGYITEPSFEAIQAVAAALEAKGECIRCEHFMKFDPSDYTATGMFIPFIDTIDNPVSRKEVYDMFKLEEQGYKM